MKKQVKNLLSSVICCIMLAIVVSGCGEKSPKDTVEEFIEACEDHDFEEAASMVYDSYSGKCISADDYRLPYIAGDETHGSIYVNFSAMLSDGRADFGTYPLGTGETNGTEKYEVSPREVIFDKNNPNKCVVLVFAERTEKSYLDLKGKNKPIPSPCQYSKKEVEWELEKINGKWMIVHIGEAKRSHTVNSRYLRNS